MSRIINESKTLTFNPVSVDEDLSTYADIDNVSSAYTDGTSTSYATIYLITGSYAETYVYFNFDTSEIPQGAEITSVSCVGKGYVSTTSTRYLRTKQMQLCSGSKTKGSATTLTQSATSATMSVGSWTEEELREAKIRVYVERGTSGTSSSNYYARFYGATLSVTYSINGTMYEITATSSVDGVTVEPESQEAFEGEDALVTIRGSLTDVDVLDNGVSVTDLLVEKRQETSGTVSAVPKSYTTSGSISGTRYQNAIGNGADAEASSGNDYCSSSGRTAHIDYSFDFSNIPSNATITNVTVKVKGHCESTSNSSEVARLQLYSGSTSKGSQVSFTSTSDTVITMTPGTWNRSELDDAILRFTIGYYGGQVSGATWTVEYEMPSSTGAVYYEYTITGLGADHIIIIEEAGPFVPPEEDENYTYYPITISSINASTDPRTGTVRVKEGSSQTITIEPTESKVTLILDNGVDVSAQLVGHAEDPSYSVDDVNGASYGFELNSSGYYESTNAGHSNSASLARVNMILPCRCLVTFTYINYAEATYDYGLFGKIDKSLGKTYSIEDDDPELACATSSHNKSTPQTLTYEVESGEHFIDVKYFKDQYTDDNNDSLQFKVAIEALENTGSYTYTLTNIQQKHSLIFVFGDVEYYFVTSAVSGEAKIYPDGQTVKLAGQSYQLVVVPDDLGADVSIKDNNIDVTAQLVKETGTTNKGDEIVNYTYSISDVSSAHTLEITVSGSKIYIKINGVWEQFSTVYKKIDGRWVEQSDPSAVLSTTGNYIKST